MTYTHNLNLYARYLAVSCIYFTADTTTESDVENTSATSTEQSGPLPAVGILTVLVGAIVFLLL